MKITIQHQVLLLVALFTSVADTYTFAVTPTDLVVSSGDTITVTCTISGYSSDPGTDDHGFTNIGSNTEALGSYSSTTIIDTLTIASITTDTTFTCFAQDDGGANTQTKVITVDVVVTTDAEVATTTGAAVSLTCAVSSTATEVNEIVIGHAGTEYKTNATSNSATFITQDTAASSARVSVSGITDDVTYTCTFNWDDGGTIETTTSAVEVITISVDVTQTNSGSNSPTITCTVGDISSEPTTFSYTMGDGTTTWDEDSAVDNEAAVTAANWDSSNSQETGTLVLDADYFNADKTITCTVTYGTSVLTGVTANADLVTVEEVVVATTTGADVALICDVSDTDSTADTVTITYGGTAYVTGASSNPATFTTQDAGQTTATVTVSGISDDVTYTCTFAWTDESTIETTTSKVEIVTIGVDTVQANLGDNSPAITCTVGTISSQPGTFSYTFGDGTSTWAENTNTNDTATTTAASYSSSNSEYTGTVVLDAAYFTADKTLTCTVTYGYSTLTASATADTVSVKEVVVATTSGGDVDLYCDVEDTSTQVETITITYDGTSYVTGASSNAATFTEESTTQSTAKVTVTGISAEGTYTCAFAWSDGSTVTTTTSRIELVTISVDTTQTNLGDNSPTITCTVGDISAEPTTFSYTMGDGTTTWNEDSTTDNEATVTDASWSSSDSEYTGTIVLLSDYFTADKTITCTVTYEYSTLTASALQDTVSVQEVTVATTSGTDVALICEVTDTATQIDQITITYSSTAYNTDATEASFTTQSAAQGTASATVSGITADGTYTCAFIWDDGSTITTTTSKVEVVTMSVAESYTLKDKASEVGYGSEKISCVVGAISESDGALLTDFTFGDGTSTWDDDATADKATTNSLSDAWDSDSSSFTGTLSFLDTYCSSVKTPTITCSVTYGYSTISTTATANCFTTRFIVISDTNKALNGEETVTYTNTIVSIEEPTSHDFSASSFGSNYEIVKGTWDATNYKVVDTLTLTKPTTDITFSCTSTDSDSDGNQEESDSYTLDVIDITVTDYYVENGETATLTCVASNVLSNTAPNSIAFSRSGTDYSSGVDTNTTSMTVTLEKAVTSDTTFTCTFNWDGADSDASSTSAVTNTVTADVVELADIDVATTSGAAVSLICEVTDTTSQPSAITIKHGSTEYVTGADASFTTHNSSQSTASVSVSGITADDTYTCYYVWSSVVTITSGDMHVDIVTIAVDTTYTKDGSDSAAITCTVDAIRSGHSSSPVSALTFNDGTTTWNNGDDVTDEATVSDIGWSSDVVTSTLTLKSTYFTADKTLTCSVTFGYSTLSATAVADIFELSKTSWVMTTGQAATLTCGVTGLQVEPTIQWAAADTDHEVVTSDYSDEARTTTLTLDADTITADSSQTCTITISGTDYAQTVLADVVVLTGKGYAQVSSSYAIPQCCVTGAAVEPTSLLFKDSTKTYSASETGYALSDGTYASEDLCNTMNYTTTTADHTFTCVLSMYSNTLEASAVVDIFTFDTEYSNIMVEKGTDLVLTVTTSGWTSNPAITWVMGSSTYLTGTASEVTETDDGSAKNVLTLAAADITVDVTITLQLAFDYNTISSSEDHDIFDLGKSDDVIIQKGNSTSVWCTIENYDSDVTYEASWTTETDVTSTTSEDITDGHKTTLTNSATDVDVTYTCSFAFGTSAALGTFTKTPTIDVIQTPATGDYVKKGSDAKVTCKVTDSENDGTIVFEIDDRKIKTVPETDGDWCKYGDIVADAYVETDKTETLATMKTTCDANSACQGFTKVSTYYYQITATTFTTSYSSGAEVYFKETCPSITSIVVSALSSGNFSSVVTVAMSEDTGVDCHITIGSFEFEALSSVDVFELSGTGYVTVEDEGAYLTAEISGSALALSSQDIFWVEESGDGAKQAQVAWTQWDDTTQSRSTSSYIESITTDTTYTCTFNVNDVDWTYSVDVDVIQKSVTNTTVKAGSATTLKCGYTNQTTAHSNVWWNGTFSGQLSETEDVTGYTFAKSTADSYTYTSMTIAAATEDSTYTCNHQWETNTLSWVFKSDTFTISTSSYKTESGTTASLTCSVIGTDSQPTSWKWNVASTDYSETTSSAGVTMTTSDYSSENQDNVLQLASQTADSTVTCKVTVDGNEYSEDVAIDVIEIATTSRTVKDGAAATLSCTVTGSSSEPTDIYWYVDGGDSYKASTTTTGYTVVKTDFASGEQNSELRISAASADTTYTCKVEYSTNSFDKTATVDIYALATSQVTTEVLTGKAATFTCTVSGSQTEPSSMSWTVDGDAVADGSAYTITTSSYASETMTSVLVIAAVAADSSIICKTNVEFDGETSAVSVDAYAMSSQATVSYDTVASTVVMQITGINSNVDLSRIAWYLDSAELTNTTLYTSTRSYSSDTTTLTATLTVKAGTATANTKSTYSCRLDGIADYSASSTLDVATFSYSPSTINLVDGTSYLFTVTLTGYAADYSSYISWWLDTTELTATSTTWDSDTKELKTIVDAVGASPSASNSLKFKIATTYSTSESTSTIEVSEITYASHTQIKSGSTLTLTSTVTNAQSDISSAVSWINNGITLATGGDYTVSSNYDESSKEFVSTLTVANYDETDQIYTNSVTMAGSTTQKKLNVWQFVYFETNQAVSFGEASATLTCKVSGSDTEPSTWSWTPAKTSQYFEQTEGSWNSSEGSQESYIKIYNITENMHFTCEATIDSTAYSSDVIANTYGMMPVDDQDGIRYVYSNSEESTLIEIVLEGLELDVNITVTFGDDTYKSWKNDSSNHTWFMISGPEMTVYLLELKNFTGTSGNMTFVTSRQTPAEYTPATDLGHSITEILMIKFFTGSVTSNAIVDTGGTANLTCTITGADLSHFVEWFPGADTELEGTELTVSASYDSDKDETVSVLTTPSSLSTYSEFVCEVFGYSGESDIWYFEQVVANATTTSGTAVTLGCAIVGSPSEPSEVYWIDGDSSTTKYKNTTTTSGYTVNNTVFDSGSGVQISTLTIDSPTADKYYTCYMDVNNVQVSATALVDVIAISGSDVTVLSGADANVSVSITGIGNGDMSEYISFSTGSDTHYTAHDHEVSFTDLASGNQTFTLALSSVTADATYTFTLELPNEEAVSDTPSTFNTTVDVDELEMSVTHGKGNSGGSADLVCTIVGASSSPSFLWTVNGVAQNNTDDTESDFTSSTGTKTSTWSTGTVTADTTYQCIASIGTKVFTLETYYDVFSMSMLDAYILWDGTPAITCLVDNAKSATLDEIQWYQSSTELASTEFTSTYDADESTSIVSPSITSDKTYTCKIGDVSVDKQIDLYNMTCTTGTATSGETATIVCSSDGLQTATSVTWNLTSGTYTSEEDTTSGLAVTLKITELTADTVAKLSLASPDGNTQYTNANAYVRELSTETTIITTGETATLSCTVKGASAAPDSVAFTYSSTNYDNVTQTSLTDGSLTATVLTPSTVTEDRTYTCSFVFGSTTLTMSPKADVIAITATTITALPTGSSQTFTCGYSAAQANHDMTWSTTGTATNTATSASAGTSTLAVTSLTADSTITCSIGDAEATIALDIYDVTATVSPSGNLVVGNSVSVTCTITGLETETDTTWNWYDTDGSAISSGITSDNSKSVLILSSLTTYHMVSCKSTKNGNTITKEQLIPVRYVETSAMSHNDGYEFMCNLHYFTSQPVPTYWASTTGVKYTPDYFTKHTDHESIMVATDEWDSDSGDGMLSLNYINLTITEDLTYTCRVEVDSDTILNTTATIDFMSVAVASTKVYVLTGETLTLTATFSGLASDYSSDIVWTLSDTTYTASSTVSGYEVSNTYSSTANTLVSTFTITGYKIDDAVASCAVNRTDVNPSGSSVDISVDQFDITFNNAYSASSDSDVSVTCKVTNNNNGDPDSIAITGPSTLTATSSTGTQKAGTFSSVSSDTSITCSVAYEDSVTATSEKKIEIVSISVSDQSWSDGDAYFTATISDTSFNIVSDVTWYINNVKTTSNINTSYSTGASCTSVMHIEGVESDGNVTIEVGSSTGSAATATKTLEYYYLTVNKTRVESGSASTTYCYLNSYTGTGLTELKLSATDGTTTQANTSTTSTDRAISVTISSVTADWDVTCSATISSSSFSETNVVTPYSFSTKLNSDAQATSGTNWVTLNDASTMLCEISDSEDSLTSAPTWYMGTTQITSDVSSTSNNSYSTLTYTMTTDATFTCKFDFGDETTTKTFSITTKGCMTPTIGNGTYTPSSTLEKVTPGDTLTFSCSNSTKYSLTGDEYLLCSNSDIDGTTSYHSYNGSVPTCTFVGDCSDITTSFSHGSITPSSPFANSNTYTFSCDSDYRLDGNTEVECSSNNWQKTIAECNAIIDACDTDDWGKAYANFEGPYVAGDVVSVYCSSGYSNTGTGSLTCGTTGWDTTAECVKKEPDECSSISVTSGTIGCTNSEGDTTTTYAAGVSCSLSCDANYKAVGDSNAIVCQSDGTWNQTSYPSCAAYQAPTTRTAEVTMTFATSYCSSDSEKTKMEAAVETTLSDVQEISCLKNSKCEVTDFACAKTSDSAFELSFKLNQISDMTNTSVLTESTGEIETAEDSLTFSISSSKKKRSVLDRVKRGATYTFSPSTVEEASQVSTCASNTYLENNLCVECPSGYYLNSGACAACGVGTYNPSDGATACTSCSTGYTTLTTGSSAETQCTRTCTVPLIDNVNTTTLPMGSTVEEGALVYYTCDDGYSIDESAVYTCAPDYTEVKPSCKSDNNNMLWYLVAVCGGILILALFLLVCFCCGIRMRSKENNSGSHSSSSSNSSRRNYILENKYNPRQQEATYANDKV